MKAALLGRIAQSGISGLTALPERMLRKLFGDPPHNDRSTEQDLHTHAVLRLMALSGQAKLHEQSVRKARRLYALSGALFDLPRAKLVDCQELELPGAEGPLRARAYLPAQRSCAGMLLWFHGGGYVIGNLDTHAGALSNLASWSGVPIVAIDYRKSPEHRFPAASDDGLASLRWAREHAGQFDCEGERVAIGGDSAGANLCAGMCHRLRDAGEAQPALQVLVYPLAQCNSPFPSRTHFAAGPLLTRELIQWFRSQYLPSPASAEDPRISVLLSERFDALAPALIRTAGFDPLRDEGEAYAHALRDAGVAVDLRCEEALIHGYLTMGTVSPANRDAVAQLGADLRRALVGS